MSEINKIIYVGNDESYWKTIKTRYQNQFSTYKYEFIQFFFTEEKRIQQLIIDIINEDPHLIYIDFSKYTQEYLHLARLCRRVNHTRRIPLVGLHDNNTAQAVSMYAVNANVYNNHVKSGEVHDVVYDGINLLYPGINEKLDFAMAQASDETYAYEVVKISTISEDRIRFEASRDMAKDSRILMANFFSSTKVLHSNYFTIKEKGVSGLYYNENFWYQVEPLYINPIPKDPEASEELMRERENDRLAEIPNVQHKFKTWVYENLERSSPKAVKMLIVDRLLNIYQNQPLSDRYNYVIRCQPYLREVEEEVKKMNPDIIFFQMDDERVENIVKQKKRLLNRGSSSVSEEELKKDAVEEKKLKKKSESKEYTEEELQAVPVIQVEFKNDETTLKKIIDLYRPEGRKKPFFIIYNVPTADSKQLQGKYNYPNIIAQPGLIETEIAMQMAHKLDQRIEANAKNLYENQVVLRKENPQTFAEIAFPIKIINICESEIWFQCNEQIALNTAIRVNEPIPMYLTIVPHNDSSTAAVGKEGYRGLINCTSEEGKKEIRKHVNSIFFRELEAKKSADREEFDKVQKAAVRRKEEMAKKEAEMKAKAEAEKLKAEAEVAKAKEAKKQQDTSDNSEEKE